MKNFFSRRCVNTAIVVFLLTLSGCQTPLPVHHADLTPVTYQDIPGWQTDTQIEALPALKRSCAVLLKQGKTEWGSFCHGLEKVQDTEALKQHMEQHLKPYQVADNGERKGLFTGYYEPELEGSRHPHGQYQTPLYKMPKSGIRYKIPRSQIVKGALARKNLELVWVDDAVDAFFLQIQGSGRIRMEDGSIMRLGYAGQNGYPYTPIGKVMLEKGILEPGTVTMQSIKKWLEAHPQQAESIMSKNASYVFFRVIKGQGPIGSQGVPLTPQRSLAIDRSQLPMGAPLWISAEHPLSSQEKLQRLVVAQDTGGAIKGAVRGDYFWGHGPDAAQMAGVMQSSGYLYVFLPQ